MQKVTVCYQCPDRRIGCHSECERYLTQKAKRDSEKHTAIEGRRTDYELKRYKQARSQRLKKYRKGGI